MPSETTNSPKPPLRIFPALAARALPLVLPAAVVGIWFFLTHTGNAPANAAAPAAAAEPIVSPLFLPPPSSVLGGFSELWRDDLLGDFTSSATTVLRGYAVGAIIGVAIGSICGLLRPIENILAPSLNTLRQVPGLAWLPLLVLWFGAGDTGKTVLIAQAVFYPVFLNTLQGVRGVPIGYIEVGRIFGMNRLTLFRRIVLPASLPFVFTGLRYGAGIAWAVLVVAEMLGARRGLGYLLMRSQELMHTHHLFVLILLIGTVGFTIDLSLRRLEARLSRWRKTFAG